MGREAVVEQLQRLGLSGYEAKAYVALVAAGEPLNGYEVAKHSGVPRSTVYETLGKLVARGAAFEVRVAASALAYVPLPVETLLARMRNEFDRSVEELREALPTLAAPAEASLLHHLHTRTALFDRIRDVIVQARREVLLSLWQEEAAVLRADLVAADGRGVDLWQVAMDDGVAPVGHTYRHSPIPPTRALQRLGCRLLVVVADREAVVIGGLTRQRSVGVFTDDPAVVRVAVESIQHDIALRVLVDQVGAAAIQSIWRTDPALRRLIRGPRQPLTPAVEAALRLDLVEAEAALDA